MLEAEVVSMNEELKMAEKDKVGGGRNIEEDAFIGVDGAVIRNPPRNVEPRERNLPDGTEVK